MTIVDSRRVLVIGINYRPELTGIGPYTSGLVEHLAGRGDQVTVIAGLPHYPDWRLGRGTERVLVREEVIDKVRIIRAGHYIPASQDAMRRAAYEATFGLTALLSSYRLDRPDAILAIVPTLSSGVLARLLGRRFATRYGILFQDLMGPASSQSGMAGGALVARATALAERWSAARAAAIGVVSTSFAPYLTSLGIPRTRIVHVPNWSREARPTLSAEAVRTRFGWTDGRQVVLHAGNIGLKQGLDQIVTAARLAAGRGEQVRFVLSGGGSQAAAIETAARGLDNVQLLGLQPDDVHASLLGAADVLLLSERASQKDMSLPSKLTAYHAAGRPIVAAVPIAGATAAEVERSGAGLVVPAGRPDALLEALTRLRQEPALAARLAAAGPAYATTHTSQAACLDRAAAFIDRIAAGSREADPALSTAA